MTQDVAIKAKGETLTLRGQLSQGRARQEIKSEDVSCQGGWAQGKERCKQAPMQQWQMRKLRLFVQAFKSFSGDRRKP